MNHARPRLALLIVVMLVASGCATTSTPQTDAFNALKTIRAAVEGSLKVFNAGYQAGTYTDAQRDQLRALYVKYQFADTVAARALDASIAENPTELVQKVTALAGDVIRFVEALK